MKLRPGPSRLEPLDGPGLAGRLGVCRSPTVRVGTGTGSYCHSMGNRVTLGLSESTARSTWSGDTGLGGSMPAYEAENMRGSRHVPPRCRHDRTFSQRQCVLVRHPISHANKLSVPVRADHHDDLRRHGDESLTDISMSCNTKRPSRTVAPIMSSFGIFDGSGGFVCSTNRDVPIGTGPTSTLSSSWSYCGPADDPTYTTFHSRSADTRRSGVAAVTHESIPRLLTFGKR